MPLIDGSQDEFAKCQCGRNMREIHCTDSSCGSFAVERKSRREIIEVETEKGKFKIDVDCFRCRRCGFRFNDKDRYNCQAPKRGLSVKAQRVGDAAQVSLAGLSETERIAKLTEMFGGKKK